jgi:hypothetical protein
MDLRRRIDETLTRIISLSDQYIRVYNSQQMNQYAKYFEVEKLKAQLDLQKDDYSFDGDELSRESAELAHRPYTQSDRRSIRAPV